MNTSRRGKVLARTLKWSNLACVRNGNKSSVAEEGARGR